MSDKSPHRPGPLLKCSVGQCAFPLNQKWTRIQIRSKILGMFVTPTTFLGPIIYSINFSSKSCSSNKKKKKEIQIYLFKN